MTQRTTSPDVTETEHIRNLHRTVVEGFAKFCGGMQAGLTPEDGARILIGGAAFNLAAVMGSEFAAEALRSLADSFDGGRDRKAMN
ncbi:MAG TPA: hypothetical protein VK629_10755 [Steroidobacteraceae bacterium]|nr:hypothetical protein [Steroidobacteraceae bacterium]